MAGLNLPTYLKGEEPKEATIIKEEKKVIKPTYQFKEEKSEKKDDDSPDDSVKE